MQLATSPELCVCLLCELSGQLLVAFIVWWHFRATVLILMMKRVPVGANNMSDLQIKRCKSFHDKLDLHNFSNGDGFPALEAQIIQSSLNKKNGLVFSVTIRYRSDVRYSLTE